MTSMEQIEHITIEARKLGMKYGEYVEKYGHTLPKPEVKAEKEKRVYIVGRKDKAHNRRVDVVCEECGVTFSAGRKTAKFCPKCTEARRLEWARKYKKRMKEKGV